MNEGIRVVDSQNLAQSQELIWIRHIRSLLPSAESSYSDLDAVLTKGADYVGLFEPHQFSGFFNFGSQGVFLFGDFSVKKITRETARQYSAHKQTSLLPRTNNSR